MEQKIFVCSIMSIQLLDYIVQLAFEQPTFYEFNLTKGYMAAMIMYMIIELGTSCYRYSWYGPNIFVSPALRIVRFSIFYYIYMPMILNIEKQLYFVTYSYVVFLLQRNIF